MFKKLNAKIENLFDQDSSHNLAFDHSLIEARTYFRPTVNLAHLENLSYIYTGEVNSENIESLFAQIACYFEINFLLLKNSVNPKFKCNKSILYGKPLKNLEAWPALSFPSTPLFKVFKTGAASILKRFSLSELDVEKKMMAYLLKISDDCILVVATETAEPWAKIKVESLHNTLLKINFKI